MALKNLNGTGVALVTPFRKNGTVDTEALQRIVKHVSDGGVEYLVVLGTTAESVTLSKTEKQIVLETIQSANKKKLPVILGVGGNNTAEIIFQLDAKELKGVDAILSVTPYYNKPNQTGLYEHYKAIARNSPLPVILYNVPGRTGINMTAETQLKLAHQFSNIIATKEASGNMDQIQSIIKSKPKNFTVISGDDNLTLAMIACGAMGVISVSANAYPKQMSNMVRFAIKNNMVEARKLHYQLFDITNMMFAEGSPGGVKEILQYKGLCNNDVRMPLANVSSALSKKIKSAML